MKPELPTDAPQSNHLPLQFEALTHRELDILALLDQNLSDREIAQRLTLALSSVKWYARQIYAKLGVENRRQAVLQARALSLLESSTRTSPPVINPQGVNTPFLRVLSRKC